MNIDLAKDIYYDPRLGRLYAMKEKGEFVEYVFENSLGKIQHQFIIRPIDRPDEEGQTWYDLTTPYGYGGPLILDCNEEDKEELVRRFHDVFSLYCKDKRIVSEFIRFHPVGQDVKYFSSMYTTKLHNYTVGTNIEDYDDPFTEEFSKSTRKTIRKGIKDGLTYKIEENPSSLADFQKIYYETMDRNEAADGYYFDEEYFQYFVDEMPEKLLKCSVNYGDEVVAMGMYFVTEEMLHAHLSGTKTDYLYLSPAYLIRYAFLEWGCENEIKLIHHGGGTTSDFEDSLFRFKKQFGKNTVFPFYLGTKIWNEEVYDYFVAKKSMVDKGFFPAYRVD